MATDVKNITPQPCIQDMQLVVFRLGNEAFGSDIAQIREIIRPGEITVIPQAPDYVEGVINLRGKITTVVNLRRRMGMESKPADSNTRIIVVETDGSTIGLLVDSVTEVIHIRGNQVEPISGVLQGGQEQDYLIGVCKLKQLLILADLRKVLSRIS